MSEKSLLDLVQREPTPAPWSAGDNIPWHEPGFSARMLAEHLSQAHDAASRRFEKIDAHVQWIHRSVLRERPSRILDLGCGPGLYTERLARMGHSCVGIDVSPASLAHARDDAERDGLACSYVLADVRCAPVEGPFDLAMMLYGEFNVFEPSAVRSILEGVRKALRPAGRLLLEPHTFDAVRAIGLSGTRWHASAAGLFSEKAHILLEENHWDEQARAATTRFHVIDAETSRVTTHGRTMQAYTEAHYMTLLARCGFGDMAVYPSLTGAPDETQQALIAILASRQATSDGPGHEPTGR